MADSLFEKYLFSYQEQVVSLLDLPSYSQTPAERFGLEVAYSAENTTV